MLSDKQHITTITKFVASLLVVNGHLFLFYSNMPEISRWMNLGSQCVSLFLFFSAYGLMFSYSKKGKVYLDGFILHRLGKILLPLFTAYALCIPIYRIFIQPVDWIDLLQTLYWGGPYLKYTWFVTEITILYLLFFICAKSCKSDLFFRISLTCSVILLIILLFINNQPLWYINGLPCFVLGIWYQKHESQIETITKQYRWACISSLSLFFILFFQWHLLKDNIPFLSAYRYEYVSIYLSNILFVLICIFCIDAIKNESSKEIKYDKLFRISIGSFYEIYLIQNVLMIIFASLCLPLGYMWLFTLCSCILIAVIMKIINKRLSLLLLRFSKKIEK